MKSREIVITISGIDNQYPSCNPPWKTLIDHPFLQRTKPSSFFHSYRHPLDHFFFPFGIFIMRSLKKKKYPSRPQTIASLRDFDIPEYIYYSCLGYGRQEAKQVTKCVSQHKLYPLLYENPNK